MTADFLKGVATTIVLAGLAFGGYLAYTGREIESVETPPTIEERLAQIPPEQIEAARERPEQAYLQAKNEDLGPFLAFLDHDLDITDEVVEEYVTIFNRLNSQFPANTPKEVVNAIFIVHNAEAEVGFMRYMDAMRYLSAGVAAPGGQRTPDQVIAGRLSPANVPSNDCSIVALQVYESLLAEYYKPIIEAELQEQQRLQAEAQAEYQRKLDFQQMMHDNFAEARERGAAKNAARDQRAAERAQEYQRRVDEAYRNYRQRAIRDSNWRQRWTNW